MSVRLILYVSVYIMSESAPGLGLTEGNVRRISSSAQRKVCSSIAIMSHAVISPQTLTHFSQYFTGLHNLAP
jgi:hypothetical protein